MNPKTHERRTPISVEKLADRLAGKVDPDIEKLVEEVVRDFAADYRRRIEENDFVVTDDA
jgi:hypothetical protein